MTLLDRIRAESSADRSREDRAKRIAHMIRNETGRRWVGVYAVTPTEVVYLAWSGPSAPAYPRFAVGQGLTGTAIAERTTAVSIDVAADPRYLVALETTGSEMFVPVLVGDEVVGTVDVEDARRDAFDDEDQKLFEEIATALQALFE
jgi:L-methionine (R)-S-oxide reductase